MSVTFKSKILLLIVLGAFIGRVPLTYGLSPFHLTLAVSVVACSMGVAISGTVGSYFLYRNDPFALLTGTLKTIQKAACDGEYMSLRCPTGTTISISMAQYGDSAPSPSLCQQEIKNYPELIDTIKNPHNNNTCILPSAIQYELLQKIVAMCQKKGFCKFQTSPGTFGGDPCPSSRKFVEVAYKCRPSEFKGVIGCEAEVIQLKCNRTSRLAIYSANYGRVAYESPQCPQPSGVPEESCLSSFSTEGVMQMCHGKRSCSLSVDKATFGSPCRPESFAYLKVIYTCVPRKVLQEKYQGEPEPDEMFEDETEYEAGDPVGGVVEQPSIYSPDHSKSKGWVNLTSKPSTTSKSYSSEEKSMGRKQFSIKSSAVQVQNDVDLISGNANAVNPNNSQDMFLIYLISQGIHSYEFISRNTDKLWLYIAISSACCGMVIVSAVLVVKIWVGRSGGSGSLSGAGCPGTSKPPSSSSAGPLTSAGRLSDIDELSVVMDDIAPSTILPPSILRKPGAKASSASSAGDELGRSFGGVATLTSGPNTMTSASISSISPPLPATMTLGRGLNRQRESTNIRFYYD